MTLEDIIVSIKDHGIEGDRYYSYPTGTVGSSYISMEDEDTDGVVVHLVNHILDAAVAHLGIHRDNKTAVRCFLNGNKEQPVYFAYYDGRCIICTEISPRSGSKEFELK